MTVRVSSKIGFIFIILSAIYCTDIAVVFGIPYIQPVLGFFFLTVIPGFLVVEILAMNQLSFFEKMVLSIGLSIALVMIIGVIQNLFFDIIGYSQPLSIPLTLLSYSVITLALLSIWYLRLQGKPYVPPHILPLTRTEKCILILSATLPTITFLGTYLLDIFNQNGLLIVLFFCIPLIIIIVGICRADVSSNVYVIILFIIALSLVMILPLRSDFLIGSDTHSEFYYFITTLQNGLWMVTSGILSGCISITILPTVYWNYVGTNPELLFKYLYPLLYIVTPIVVFYIGTKYMNNWDAFLSSCTFIFATNFFVTTANARTSVAMIFVVFMLWIIFTGSIEFYKKGLLFSICCIACVIAHYATAFLFFLIITFAITGYYILKNLHLLKNTLEKYFKIGYILIIGTFIFFWYGLINFQILNLQVNYIHIREQLINEIVVSPIPQNTVILYPILRIILLLRGVFYYFIIIGAIVLLLLLFQKSIFGDQNFKSNIFKKVPEIEYCIVVFICCFFLEITNYYPVAFIGYGVDRVGALIMLILPFIFIVGIKGITEIVLVGCNVFQKKVLKNENRPINFFINHLTSQKNIIIYSLILLIMIANLYCITGFGFQIAGEPNSLLFNSPEASQAYNYGSLYIHPQENSAITWMVRTIDRFDYNVFFDASSGGKVISRTTNTQIANSRTSLGNPHDYNYYFLSYPNVNYDDFSFNIGSQTNINEYTSLLKGQDLIYSNGGSQFLYRIR